MKPVTRRELTYDFTDADDPVTRGREGGLLRGAHEHHLETCDKPICRETMRIIRARGPVQKTPK